MTLDDLGNLALDMVARDLGEPRLPPSRLVLAHAAEVLMILVPGRTCGTILLALGCASGSPEACLSVARAMSSARFDPALPPRIAARIAALSAQPRAA